MRTRSASLAEKYGVFGAIGFVLLLTLIGAFLIFRGYSKDISDLKARKSELLQKEKENKLQISKVLSANKNLTNQLKNKQSKIDREKDQYDTKKDELESYLDMIPPYYMKSYLRKRIQIEAKSLNLDVLSYNASNVDVSKYEKMKFFPLQFSMDIQGDYSAVKRFLWFIDENIVLDDVKVDQRKWSFIVKIAEQEGLKIIDPNKRGPQGPRRPVVKRPATPRAPVAKTQGNQAGAEPVEEKLVSKLLPLPMYALRKDGLLENEKMRLNLKLITYLRKLE